MDETKCPKCGASMKCEACGAENPGADHACGPDKCKCTQCGYTPGNPTTENQPPAPVA